MKKYAILALTAVMATSILTVPAKALPTQPQGIVEGGCVLGNEFSNDYCRIEEGEELSSLEALPTCQFGDNNSNVKHLQCQLHIIGYKDLDEVGVFGPNTLKAVKDFQEKHNLKVDGIVDSEDWEEIKLAAFNKLMENHNRTHRHII
ncbi:peptidoglycan-binding domain-containing protein [Clostridium butanoliproducens]|uniref:peptidoglycan-binding domain-containing protein n=1 Tax=Clostridium butanoliproducens TaxID=2991837 RepID=UPI0024BA89A5|nr:peptidoglycan-binding domain-containing protein [Clostridium butanoliproducens]